jgi:hypothetical protein
MNAYRRKPEWTVTIRRPDYTRSTLVFNNVDEWYNNNSGVSMVQFVSSKRKEGFVAHTDLIEYGYDNTLKNPANPFSLTMVPKQDKNGLSWKDKIRARDVVFISEFGKTRYIGVVTGTGYTMSLDNRGAPQRTVSINGESFGGILQSFNIPMNVYLWYGLGTTAKTENYKFIQALNSKLDEGQTAGDMFNLIKKGFIGVALGAEANGFPALLNKYLELNADNLEVFYPMNIKPFQQNSNTLWQIFRQILPEPIYEIFGRYENEKYKLICRESPFDLKDWNNLKITKLNPLFLLNQNLNDSDAEVFTHFFSQMPNSAFSENEIYANSFLSEISVFDKEKLSIYGYKQLMATFPFFDLDKGKDFSSIKFLKKNSVRLYAWYRNNVEFQSGSITMMTVPDENNEYIKIGERIQYLQGSNNSIEFYVEGINRKMKYPDTMTSTYSVTRGYEYGSKTVTVDSVSVDSPQVRKISQLGRKLVQTEQNALQESGKI